VKQNDGSVFPNIHFEDVLITPEGARNMETSKKAKEPLKFQGEQAVDELHLHSSAVRRSPGMMMENQGEARDAAETQLGVRPGQLDKISAGVFIAYDTGKSIALAGRKTCCVGRVLNVSKAEQAVIVHKHKPVSDGHLLLKWEPVFHEDGAEVLGTGSKPSEITVPVKQILEIIQLHDGTISHAAGRALHKRGYGFDDEGFRVDCGMSLARSSDRGDRLEALMRTLGGPFSVNLSGANNSVGIAQFADGRSAAKLHWDS